MTRERPILFSAPMVRAILAGTKTQTRRVVKARHIPQINASKLPCRLSWSKPAPYGQPGDLLWVRETHAKLFGQDGDWITTDYRATYTEGSRLGDVVGIKKRWTPAIHMPRWASRITLRVTGVRVDRLQDISEADAQAEGIERGSYRGEQMHWRNYLSDSPVDWCVSAKNSFRTLWSSINGADSWDANPFVWVVEFARVEGSGNG